MSSKNSDCSYCHKSTAVIVSVILASTAILLLVQGGIILFFPLLGLSLAALLIGWNVISFNDFFGRRKVWPTKPKTRTKKRR